LAWISGGDSIDPFTATGMRLCVFLLFVCFGRFCALGLDLTRAVVVTEGESPRLRKAAIMLVEEVEKRAGVRWPIQKEKPNGSLAIVLLHEKQASGAEGFTLRANEEGVWVDGNDERGVMFGTGRLLRELRMTRGKITIEDGISITTTPKYPLRGHQLGYRPKTHSYDAWDLKTWEQYYRDLIVFGANAVELVPPRSDDDKDSPHFPLPPMEMMIAMSKLADDYGLDVWIWYPAMDKDYSDPKTVEFALKEWAEVFSKLPRIDVIFVPGGDPGHTQPKHLMALLEKQTTSLRKYHPKAQVWVSPQSFNKDWLDEFLELVKAEPAWLGGIVFGPQVRISLPELRKAIPRKYPIRHYPDITHTRQCQYPVPDWDVAFAITEGRECINPRPIDEATIFKLLQPDTIGFLTYSEGCNDDVNKAIWSALGWDPQQSPLAILREYARYFIGPEYEEGFAQGLLALERNWRGPLIANENVHTTLRQFQEMERKATPQQLANWRFQQALFRSYYDAYLRARLIYERRLEDEATQKLREAPQMGALAALKDAEVILGKAMRERVATDWRGRVFELAEALFQSIRMQLSVLRYKAIGVDRGASLDTIDYPLNNVNWLRERFAEIRAMKVEKDRLAAIFQIVDWENPGPGGFYDDLGNTSRQRHLVRNFSFAEDPASLQSSKAGFEEGDVVDEEDERPLGALRKSWLDHAESLVDQSLKMRYLDLDPKARYKVRVVYAGDAPKMKIRMVANGAVEIHPFIEKPNPVRRLEFDLPPETTRGGVLELSWFRPPGLGGNGRGCQVSEVWLMRK
jgi:hypothetical protein